MAYLDPREAFDHFQSRTLEAIRKQFPFDGRTQTLLLDRLEVLDDKDPDDLRAQHEAKVSGQTWGVPVIAHLILRDKATGNEVRSKTRIAELPKITKRYSQIVGGQEYQVDNQWQLKPGAYVRRRQTGQIETKFQSSKKPSFAVTFDDDTKEFRVEYKKAKLPLYPILKTLGVEDNELEKVWGSKILEVNQQTRKGASTVDQFYRTTKKTAPSSAAEAVAHMVSTFKQTDLRPDAVELTLGKAYDHVSGDALVRATKKMLEVQGGAPADDRDSLVFKDLRSVGDFAHDKIMAAAPIIKSKVLRKINLGDNPRDILRFDVFDKPIRETFHKNSAAQVAKQVNPVEMVSAAQQTTVMGPGGIQSEQSIVDETKFVNASHMGFLDPIHTPEGSKTGVTLRMPISVKKVGNEPQIPLFNLKAGKMEYVNPAKFLKSKVVLPDQVEWHGDKPVPKSSTVKLSNEGNDVVDGSFKDADYVMRHPSQFFNVTSNLIPFIGNTSGGRASMATRHMEQAISLVSREAPLVQVGTGAARPGAHTFEHIIGTQASHQSPVNGVVKAVKNDAVVIAGNDGKSHEVQIYRNYPLNDAKSVLDSTATVKVGDKVRAGQVVADTNFSKDGAIALGTNLRVGYIPYKGYNFEDGIVISESAAKKLSSVHLYKHNVPLDADTVVAKRRYMSQHPGMYSRDQLEHIGDDGLVKPGTKVMPGDPLVLSMKKSNLNERVGLSAIRKSLGEQYAERSLTWEGETAGEVVGAFRKGKEIVVHVKAIEPMQVGDKLAGRFGNKGIVTKIVPDHEMPHTPDGKHLEAALNPSGVPGRMNVGQVLETAAGKIAVKTGKPYIVQNFDGTNQLERVQSDLKKHGIKDVESLYDPTTKQKIGDALVGFQHMIKLHHQVDKKVSVRSGMNLPGAEPEKYDINLQPSGGGHTGGQAMDPLGLYALLAHGARANIREMQTWKSEGPDPNTSAQRQWQSQHHDVWDAIQHGDPLPTPRPTFAFKKFTDMLLGAGINIEKKGHSLILSPLTDTHVKQLSGDRVLTKPAELLYAKIDPKTGDPKPKPGGLFDEKLTGGHGGKKWSRMELAEPIPNPVFESSIRMLTGLSSDDYNGVVGGEHAVDPSGKIVPLGKGVTGGAGIKLILSKIDVDKDLAAAKKELSTAAASKVDKVLKRVKRLQALKDLGQTPENAYILHNLPVLPPVMRPVTVMQDGNFNFADINDLYSKFAQNNEQLKDPVIKNNLTDHAKQEIRRNLYDGVKAIMGVGIPYEDAEHKGLIHQISGATPKTGYFQSTLVSRKQDMSMRSTIVPEPGLSLDEVGLPKEHAMKLFAPFVVAQLKRSGVAQNVADAQKMVAKSTPQAQRALQRVVEERPVMLKRDPSLHKYSVQAFKPRLVEGNAIKIHPLVTGGYNADFDGDSIDLDTPILLRIQGVITYKTGRDLISLLDVEDGNYVAETRDIAAYTYLGWRPVRNVSFHEVTSKKKFRITLKNGFSFIASEDHSLMVNHAKVTPQRLTVGTALDHVFVADHSQPSGCTAWSYDKGVAYGNFFGDGCAEIRRQGGGRVAIACLPQEEREYLMNIWRKEFPNANPSQYTHGFHVNGVDLARHFLSVCGRYSDGKYIGGDLLSRGTEFLKGMLAGYILADGSVETTRSGSFLIRTWSRSKQLRDGMSVIATMLGLPHSVRERTAKGKVNYLISFGKEAIKLLDFRCAGKKGKLIRFACEEYLSNRNDDRQSQSERGYEVQSIEEVEYEERMVDLEVDDAQHVFTLLGGVVVHNTMSVFVPISDEAVGEARKMFPSNNLFSEASGKVMYQPTLESALGLYKLTRVSKKKATDIKHPAEALTAVQSGKLMVTDPVNVNGHTTTAGRILIAAALPEPLQKPLLTDLNLRLDKRGLDKLLTQVAKDHTGDFGSVADKLKDIGNGASSGVVTVEHSQFAGANRLDPAQRVHVPVGVHTLALSDFEPDTKTRERVLAPARKEVANIKKSRLSGKAEEREIVRVWSDADRALKTEHMKTIGDEPNNLMMMHLAGVKPGWGQYKQMTLAPMLVADASGRILPTPITKSYSEGLDTGEYWTQMHGARRGSVLKVQQVRDPGYLSKLLMANTMDLLVTGDDCGTPRGIALPITDRDVHDRYLQKEFKSKGLEVPAGTLLTPSLVSKMRAADKNAQVLVRSPLKCEHAKGVCQKCMGLSADGHSHHIGENVGVTSAQSLGERAVQLTLRVFHTGGAVDTSGGSKAVGGFDRFDQLMSLPKHIPDASTLAMRSGTIEKIEKDPTGVNVWVGGKRHHVGKDASGAPLWRPLENGASTAWQAPRVGMKVERGQVLSDPLRTLVNPHDLYKATNSIESVQNYLADEVHNLYKDEGIKRQHVETVVKAMSNLTKIEEPGDYEGVLRGEFHPTSKIHAINRELIKAGKKAIDHTPVLKGVDMMPLAAREDWMAKLQHQRLGQTLVEAAATLGTSNLHGLHPIPGIAYGAEFGLSRKDVRGRPALAHLQDVAEHEY